MRPVPAGLAEALDSPVLQLCLLYQFCRKDGVVVRLAGHDSDLVRDAHVWLAAACPQPGRFEAPTGLLPSSFGLDGALSSDAINQQDVLAGRWTGARLDVFVTNWSDPAGAIMSLWQGRVSAITRKDSAFFLELEGLEACLKASAGRLWQRQCDARLGDSRCALSLADPRFRGRATLVQIDGDRVLTLAPPAGLLVGRLAAGSLSFDGGVLAGFATSIASAVVRDGALCVTLAAPLPLVPAPGDAVVLTVACDHSFATCRDVFANALNFRGCPHMPGEAAGFAGPDTDIPAVGP